MRKYYISISLLSLIVLAFVILGFMEGGNPFALRAQARDVKRLSEMNNIKSAIEQYYRLNQKLPDRLEQLSLNRESYFDPQKSENVYDYEVISNTAYKLCTEFSTDTTKIDEDLYKYADNFGPSTTHKKGYDCITYTIPSYLLAKPTTTIKPTITQPTPTSSQYSEFKKSFTAKLERVENPTSYSPKIIVLENNLTKIVNLTNDSVILNKDNAFIKITDLKEGDSLLIYASAIKGSDEYTAARIHDLSR